MAARGYATEVYDGRFVISPTRVTNDLESHEYHLAEKKHYEQERQDIGKPVKRLRMVPWFADKTKCVKLQDVLQFLNRRSTVKSMAKQVIDTIELEKDRISAIVNEQRFLTKHCIDELKRSKLNLTTGFNSSSKLNLLKNIFRRMINKIEAFGIVKEQVR